MIKATTLPDPAIYGKLIALDRTIKQAGVYNKDERVRALIGACITEGIDTGGLIITTLCKLKFNKYHVGSLLNREAKLEKSERQWHCDPEGRYYWEDA